MQQTLNAVIYARYSSHNQTEQSIEGQLRDCYAFAERQGLQVVGEYIDRAITGRTDERPDFQRMIADAKKQQFQRVIVWKFDRFSRDRYDSAIYKHKLKQCGVKVLSAMENVGEGEVGIILEALLEASAEQYSLDLSKKVVRGQRESRMKGVFLGGYVPLGYKLENRKLVEDENTAPIARYIFEEYAKGVPKKKIVDALNARGLKNSKGLPFALSTVHSVLKNKKYIGIYEHGGEEVAGGCDALIDERTFYKVQELMDKRKAAPAASKATVEYLLQGKLYCGHCGTNMIAEAGHGKNGKTYHYYTCRKRRREHTCDKKNEKKGYIEWYVVEQTVEYVLTPERIEYIAAQLVAQYKKDCGLDRIQAYEKQLNRIDTEISRLVDTLAVCPAAARQPIFDKMEQLDTEKSATELDLAKLRISAKVQLTEEQIVEWLKQFCNGDALDIDFQKRIIDTFINSVYLYDDKVVIYYNIKGGKQVSYIDMLDSTEEPPFSEDAQASSGCSVLNCPAHIAKIHKSGSGTAWDSLRFQNGAEQNGCLPAGHGDSFRHIPVLRKSRAVQPQDARNHGDSRNIKFVLIFKAMLRIGRKFPIVILFQIGRNFCEIHGRMRDLVADQHSYGRYVARQGQHKISVWPHIRIDTGFQIPLQHFIIHFLFPPKIFRSRRLLCIKC